jgi:cytochrome c2
MKAPATALLLLTLLCAQAAVSAPTEQSPAGKAPATAPAPLQADCSKSRQPQRCEAMQKAQAACQDKFGPELRDCINRHTSSHSNSHPGAKKAAKQPAK